MANFLVRLCTSAVTALEVKAPKPQQPWHIPRRQIRPPPPGGCDYAHVYQQRRCLWDGGGYKRHGQKLSKGLGQGWSCVSAMLVASGADARIRRSREIAHLRRRVRNLLTRLAKHGALTRSLRFSPICRLAVSGLLDCALRPYWRIASLVRGHPDLVMWRTLLQHGVPTPKLGAHTNI